MWIVNCKYMYFKNEKEEESDALYTAAILLFPEKKLKKECSINNKKYVLFIEIVP